jgi:hypothetical protein
VCVFPEGKSGNYYFPPMRLNYGETWNWFTLTMAILNKIRVPYKTQKNWNTVIRTFTVRTIIGSTSNVVEHAQKRARKFNLLIFMNADITLLSGRFKIILVPKCQSRSKEHTHLSLYKNMVKIT